MASTVFFAASFGVADSYATCDYGTTIESETGVTYESTTNGGRACRNKCTSNGWNCVCIRSWSIWSTKDGMKGAFRPYCKDGYRDRE